MKYLEDALDFYLGGKTVWSERDRGVHDPPITDPKPELKLWGVEP